MLWHESTKPRDAPLQLYRWIFKILLLLTELTELEIGAALGLTPRTTHQYAVAILKKFGVKGRVGLMAHWLRYYRDGAA